MNKTIFKITALLIVITIAVFICSYYFSGGNEQQINDSVINKTQKEINISVPEINMASEPPEQKEPDSEGLLLDVTLDIAPPLVNEPSAELIETEIIKEQ